jgi:UDP-N-acetylglucosamine acyltransferase
VPGTASSPCASAAAKALPDCSNVPIDPSAVIAPTARIHPETQIGPQVVIGEYAVIEPQVIIGAHTRIEPYVYIKRWTTLGERNEISACTVLGTYPLDKNFKGDRSYLKIGNGNKIREHFTISRGTTPESETVIGDENFIMTSGHIAHNCRIGNRTVIASCALIAGYVEIEDQVFLSGGVVVHQFSKIGRLAMISGHVGINLDAPPFFVYAGFRGKPKGLNIVGLHRAGFTSQEISTLKTAYKILYRSNLKLEDALLRIETEIPNEHTRHLVAFIRSSKRGICREQNHPAGNAPSNDPDNNLR